MEDRSAPGLGRTAEIGYATTVTEPRPTDAERGTVAVGPGVEIARVPSILNPITGELVAWTDAAGVADVLKVLKDHRREVGRAIAVCEAALIDESERRGSKTLHLSGAVSKATVSGGSDLEWDVGVLGELVGAGLPEDRYAALVSIKQEFKVNAAVAKQIEGSNPVYAEIVARARRRVPSKRSVKV